MQTRLKDTKHNHPQTLTSVLKPDARKTPQILQKQEKYNYRPIRKVRLSEQILEKRSYIFISKVIETRLVARLSGLERPVKFTSTARNLRSNWYHGVKPVRWSSPCTPAQVLHGRTVSGNSTNLKQRGNEPDDDRGGTVGKTSLAATLFHQGFPPLDQCFTSLP